MYVQSAVQGLHLYKMQILFRKAATIFPPSPHSQHGICSPRHFRIHLLFSVNMSLILQVCDTMPRNKCDLIFECRRTQTSKETYKSLKRQQQWQIRGKLYSQSPLTLFGQSDDIVQQSLWGSFHSTFLHGSDGSNIRLGHIIKCDQQLWSEKMTQNLKIKQNMTDGCVVETQICLQCDR